jgi:two-component system chemotaxis response regulator CheB
MKPIRVLIVEDSPVVQEHLRRTITADQRFQVVGITATGEEAIQLVDRLDPHVITMDVQLPGIQGFEATRRIMARKPTPIVIVSGVGLTEASLSMEALRAGALAVVEKPVAATNAGYEAIASRLRTQLAIMSEVRVVRRRDFGLGRSASEVLCGRKSSGLYRLLAIAASTGGPNALLQMLTELGPEFPIPIAMVQHMTPGFLTGFADWLKHVTPFDVQIVRGMALMRPGTIYLSDSDTHLAVSGDSALAHAGAPVGGHRPAATVLFSSVASAFGPEAIGVLLTGMGEDGASGLMEMKTLGGFTIAEAESTAVVYGMPAAAMKLGAVCESLALHEIAPRVSQLVRGSSEVPA